MSKMTREQEKAMFAKKKCYTIPNPNPRSFGNLQGNLTKHLKDSGCKNIETDVHAGADGRVIEFETPKYPRTYTIELTRAEMNEKQKKSQPSIRNRPASKTQPYHA